MPRNKRPKPRWEERFLRLFFKDDELREKLDDLEEATAAETAPPSARGLNRFRRFLQVGRLALSKCELFAYWSLSLIRNYLTIAWRSLLRSKTTSVITVSGLALGISGFLIVSVWAAGEFGFDRFHENASSIYRVEEKRHFSDRVEPGFRTPGLLAAALEESFPEIRGAARVAWTGERILRRGDEIHSEQEILCVDPSFLSIFSFRLLEGNRETALDEPHAMVLTKSFARKYFGRENPLGEVLTVDGKMTFQVTGILEDVPANSHLRFEALVPFEVVEELGWMTDSWDFSMALTYVELGKSADPRLFADKIAGFVKTRDADSTTELVLNPLTRIRLYSNADAAEGPGRIRTVLVFLLVGFLILVIACVNFVNLATARSEHRAREVGLRKVVGAARGHVVRQFLLESVFIALVSLFIAPLLLRAALPSFNEIAGASLTWADFLKGRALLLAAGAVLASGLLSGIYPALFLSSFEPARIVKGRAAPGPAVSFLRRALVLVQVSASVILLIAAAVIYLQVDFLKAKDLGFDNERLVSIPLGISNKENGGIYRRFKDILGMNPRVLGVSAAFTHPTQFETPAVDGVFFESRRLDEETPVSISSVEAGFIETMGIRLVEGRPFSGEAEAERGHLIVNEAFRKLLGIESALGRTVRIGKNYTGSIIGVAADFHTESPSAGPVGPLLLFQNPNVNYIFVRLGPGDLPAALGDLREAWREAAPDLPFRSSFLDEDFDGLYRDLDSLASVIRVFTIIAASIAGLGLFALASFAAERRRKEIGIRKVLGQTAGKIWLMLSGDFVRLVVGACLVAWPVSWLLMRRWLADFPYRVALSWEIFVLAGLLAVAASVLTVSLHTFKASRADPVGSIRNE